MAASNYLNGVQISPQQRALIDTLKAGGKVAIIRYRAAVGDKAFVYEGHKDPQPINCGIARSLYRKGMLVKVSEQQDNRQRVLWFALAPAFKE